MSKDGYKMSSKWAYNAEYILVYFTRKSEYIYIRTFYNLKRRILCINSNIFHCCCASGSLVEFS
jgi:hypothetical protein